MFLSDITTMTGPNSNGASPSKEGPHWRNHFIIGATKGSNVLLECVHCGKGRDKPWVANATRARLHLSGEGNGVAACGGVPASIRKLFVRGDGYKPKAGVKVHPVSPAVDRTGPPRCTPETSDQVRTLTTSETADYPF